MEKIRWVMNRMPAGEDGWQQLMSPVEAERARTFHKSFPGYAPTPLCRLEGMAKQLGVGGLFVKDESKRFGLNAFKVLGGSWAIARHIAALMQKPAEELTFSCLTGPEVKEKLGETTFYTATDGNHGRGVAWAARQLHQRAVVRMPRGTSRSRLENIRREGAIVTIEDLNYDACVRMAAAEAAADAGSVLVQDTAWPGYEQIPGWIMQGYGTMASEAAEQLDAAAEGAPTHIFLQAGVGSMAGAVAGWFALRYPENPPKIVVMEAAAADCHYRSALSGDGSICTVDGDLSTMMAGLACGEPNPVSWQILRSCASAFVSCPDWVSALGMRMLAAPCPGDSPIVSGESGAVGMGLLAALMQEPDYASLKNQLELDDNSRILLFSTEGDTDPEHYRRVVWGGEEAAAK